MSEPVYIYAVVLQTFDVYDDGHYVSFHRTNDGAEAEAERLLHTKDQPGSDVYQAYVERLELKV